MYIQLTPIWLRLCWLLCFASSIVMAEPVAWDGPGKQGWLTRSSDHFDVHYPALNNNYDELAVRALSIAETVHADLTPFFATVPAHKTQLVVSDDQDIANGWASYFPFPQIRLYITPPTELSGLQNYADWLSLLIRHEYVHVLHMEMASGLPETGRHIFGRLPLLFPHSLTPPMLIEGLAVYLETDYQAGTGRLASTWYQMQMQEEVLSGSFNTLGEAAITAKDWPYGQYYLYGAFFIEYLVNTYGEDRLRLWLQAYSKEIFPWVMQNSVARRVFGKLFDQLWWDFTDAMYERFEGGDRHSINKGVSSIIETGESVRLQLTAKANVVGSPLYIVERNDEDRPVLKRCQGIVCDTLANAENIIALDVDSLDRVIAVRGVAYASGRYSGDVVILANGQWEKITHGLRVTRVRWVPETNELVALSYKEGNAHLYKVSTDVDAGESPKLLWQGSYGEYVGDYALASNTSSHQNSSSFRLVASYKQQGKAWNLAQLNLPLSSAQHAGWELLTETDATEVSPRFTAQGDIIYVADYSGRYNVWQLSDTGHQALTTSDVGMFEPWTQGDRLWVQEYKAGGFIIRNLPLSAAAPYSPATTTEVKPAETFNEIQIPALANMSDADHYRAWKTLRPYFWLPYTEATKQTTQVGIVTGGSDALGRHYYQAQVSYGSEQQAVDASLLYQYERWAFMYDVSHDLIDINPFVAEFTQLEEHQWRIERRWLFQALDDHLGLHSGAVYRSGRFVSIEPGVELIGDDSFTTASIGFAATLNYQEYLLQAPVGFGSYSHLVVEDYSLASDDVEGLHMQLGWSYLFDLPGRHSMSLALQAGVADEASPSWRLGGLPPQEDSVLFGREKLSLRGYEAGVQFGDYYERQRVGFYSQVASINNNWGLWPIGLNDIEIATYAERGRAWSDDKVAGALVGLGLELRFNLLMGYRVPVPLVLGGAHGISGVEGQTQVYARFQVPL